MARIRLLTSSSFVVLVLAAIFVPSALGAKGTSSSKAVRVGAKGKVAVSSYAPRRGITKTRLKRTAARAKTQLTIATKSPADGQTISGSVEWVISVSGSVNRVDFIVDGSTKWSDSSAPYSGTLNTTSLSNGSHVLSATAYAPKGVKATTKVTVTVANTSPSPAPPPAPEPAPTPEPEPTPDPTPEPEPAPGPTPQPNGGPIYWGATIGSHLTGNQAPWDMNAVSAFEAGTSKQASLIQFFQPFANCSPSCSFYNFPTTPLENIRTHGSIPVLSWSSQSIPSSNNEPDFQLSDVISGRYDTYIREFATKAKAWAHPFFLRFNWEMNGKWFPWHEGVNGNQPGESAKAWRHVHDIFTSVNVPNITWVWCPNVSYSGSTDLASVYPGDSYVDWTCLDGYNWGTNPAKPDKWKTFDQVYRSTYQYIADTLAPSKPMMIGEVASTEYGGSKATWIKDMLARIPTEYQKVRALVWFDKFDSNMDWPIETSASATDAFEAGIQSQSYLGNTFAGLPATKILPQG